MGTSQPPLSAEIMSQEEVESFLEFEMDDLYTDSGDSSEISDSDSSTGDFKLDIPSDLMDMVMGDTEAEARSGNVEKVVQDCIRGKEIAKIIYKLTKFKTKYDQTAELFLKQYLDWQVGRKDIINKLREFADKLDEHHKNVNISNVVGSSAAIAGSAASIAGIILSPFTFGLSLGLTIAGGATAVSGAVTSLGSSAVEYKITKDTNKEVKDILSKHSEETIEIEKTVKKLTDLYKSRERTLKNEVLGEYDIATVFKVVDMVPLANQAVSEKSNFDTTGVSGKKHIVESVCTISRTQLSVAQPLLVAPTQALRTATMVSTAAVRLTTALHVVGAIGSAAFIGFDIYNVVTSSLDLSKGSKSDSGKRIRDTADALENQETALTEIYNQLKQA